MHVFAFIADDRSFDQYFDDVMGIVESASYPARI